VGGGAQPLLDLPTTLLAVEACGLPPQEIDRRLRRVAVPVIGRVARGEYLLDLRTIGDDDLAPLLAGLLTLSC
jgi:L-seryl-tRNA(Ser) seleniumtransferase